MNILLISLIFSLGFNILMFIPAFIWKTDKLTDLSYAITFTVITLGLLLYFPFTLYGLILAIMMWLWALRLGSYLFIRIRKIKHDKRFDGMRENFWAFLKFWLLQGVSVWVVMLAAILFFSRSGEATLAPILVGASLWLIGLIVESVGDWQKYTFINNPTNKGQWIESGLWKYSRHPNYFGEILIWIGIFVYSLSVLSDWGILIAFASPLYIFLLIRFVSGVPLLEKSGEKTWGSNPGYRKYVQKTSVLLPLPPKRD